MTTARAANDAETRAPPRDREAWTSFWADSVQSRCAAGAPGVWRSLVSHWTAFADTLPRGARVLDLGCGAGAVGRLLLAARGDLRVTGVDAARVPGSTVRGMELKSETDMESLPFDDESFTAVVSQFGYEYSRTQVAAGEAARVLAPGGLLSFLVHHSQSAIVGASRERLGAVTAFLAPTVRESFCAGDAPRLDAQLALLVERYPEDDLVAQLARALPARLGWLAANRVSTWETLEQALEPERSVSDSLGECCVAPSRIDEWLEPLRGACDLEPVAVLREPDGTPIAWHAAGSRGR